MARVETSIVFVREKRKNVPADLIEDGVNYVFLSDDEYDWILESLGGSRLTFQRTLLAEGGFENFTTPFRFIRWEEKEVVTGN